MAATVSDASLPYREPDITDILVWSSFLLVLNIISYVFDRFIYVGLLGQILVGIAWGTPGGKLLGVDGESVVVNMGYLGLILLVYEGGLATSFQSLKANLWLSSFIALTGIAVPIGLSYILMLLASATPLQKFAAGAALCSTSLGTTFTVLQTSGLTNTRLGVVLTTAAMLDDVVGLVIVQVISDLGTTSDSFNAATVIRPVLVSVAFGLIIPITCRYVILPLTMRIHKTRLRSSDALLWKLLKSQNIVFVVHTLILIGMVTSASYAGTSNLFAAYLTGAAISWWDSESSQALKSVNHVHSDDGRAPGTSQTHLDEACKCKQAESLPIATQSNEAHSDPDGEGISGYVIFQKYYAQPLNRILKPFFFASIGFSIPITRMFTGHVIWRGLVYTILMFLGKFVCALWLVEFRVPRSLKRKLRKRSTAETTSTHTGLSGSFRPKAETLSGSEPSTQAKAQDANSVSLYPGVILGCAMVARGEIGLLISALAEANGIWGDEANGDLSLIVTWAILLCTIIGPVCVGLVVKRLNRPSSEDHEGAGGRPGRNPLGVWGIM